MLEQSPETREGRETMAQMGATLLTIHEELAALNARMEAANTLLASIDAELRDGTLRVSL